MSGMRFDITSIKNKYLRWLCATIAMFTIVPVACFFMVVEPLFKEIYRAYCDMEAKRLISENFKMLPDFVKLIYRGVV